MTGSHGVVAVSRAEVTEEHHGVAEQTTQGITDLDVPVPRSLVGEKLAAVERDGLLETRHGVRRWRSARCPELAQGGASERLEFACIESDAQVPGDAVALAVEGDEVGAAERLANVVKHDVEVVLHLRRRRVR